MASNIAGLHKGRPNAEESQQKAANILAVAREEFCARGYRAVTMRDIAARALVSTRTLYNQYADKLSLFTACLALGAADFPTLDHATKPGDVARALYDYAVALVRMLSSDSSRRLGMLVYREGVEFPELARAADENQRRHLLDPLAAFLAEKGLGGADEAEHARIFISMILSGWQRRVSFRQPMLSDEELKQHAAIAVRLFLHGAARGGEALIKYSL